MTGRIRAMHDSDLDLVYEIEIAAHRAPWNRQIISDCVYVGYDCRVLEIEKDGGLVLASYIISRNTGDICHVLNLCVAPDLQGQGYGRRLLQDVIDSPALSSVESIELEVRPSNVPAMHLYHHLGFKKVGVKLGYYSDEHSSEDAIVLQKLIKS